MGSWNKSKIIVKGKNVEHWLNGTKILSYSCGSKEVMERVPKTKFKDVWKFGEKITGHILLTDHTDALLVSKCENQRSKNNLKY